MDLSAGKILFILILIALIVTYIIKGLFWMSVALAAVIIYIIPAYVIIKKIYNFFKKE
jgi:membrane protein YdbS with pleckstrin-like domain